MATSSSTQRQAWAHIAQAQVARLGGALVAVVLPIIFIHVDYQPAIELGLGETSIGVELSDVAVLGLVVAGLIAGRARIRNVLGRNRGIYLALGALVLWILAEVALPAFSDRPYATATHAVAAAGFVEYALLALAVPLLVRTESDLRLLLWSLTLATAALASFGLAQFVGVDALGASPVGHRQPSYIGYHDFAAVSAATLAVGLTSLALGRDWAVGRLRGAALAAGAVGLVLSGSVAGGVGLLAAALVVLGVALRRKTLTRRRTAVAAALVATSLIAILGVRGGDLGQFARFLGFLPEERTTTEDVQSYSQRTLLVYLGWQLFVDRPLVGVGWHASEQFETLEPYLPEARREFPTLAEQAFPTPVHPYGIQNGFVQALADMGAIGFLLFVAALATPIVSGARTALRAAAPGPALAGAAALLAAAGVWTAQGLVTAAPLVAVTWLSAALVVIGRRA